MLHEFLATQREELVARCRDKMRRRLHAAHDGSDGGHYPEPGVPRFLDQVTRILERETRAPPAAVQDSRDITAIAALHGRELLQRGFAVGQVVHSYGDLCQAITELAAEVGLRIDVPEFRTLNGCLDHAIAGAVSEFLARREPSTPDAGSAAGDQRLGVLAHELRGLTHTAMLAVAAIKEGNVGLCGATGAVLDRSLLGLRTLIDRSLAEVRIEAGLPARHTVIVVADFVAELKISADLDARARGSRLTVAPVDRALRVRGDRDMLFSAAGNLLQNAFKFTRRGGEVSLAAFGDGDQVRIDVRDQCGGLPPGSVEKLFAPFVQASTDRSGVGLGLSICRRAVESSHGTVSARDLPGEGCVFTIRLPRERTAAESRDERAALGAP